MHDTDRASSSASSSGPRDDTDVTAVGAGRPAELFELDEATCASLLPTQCVGRLVTAGETPEIVPVNYVAVEGAVLFQVAAGPHADRLVGSRAAFEVDVLDQRTRSGWSVVAHGRIATKMPGGSADPMPWPAQQPWAPGERTFHLAMIIETMTGRVVRGPVDEPTSSDAYL
jgi:hypothetical protein